MASTSSNCIFLSSNQFTSWASSVLHHDLELGTCAHCPVTLQKKTPDWLSGVAFFGSNPHSRTLFKIFLSWHVFVRVGLSFDK